MGQKIHPKSVRLGYIQDWESKWFSLRDMPSLIGEDHKIREEIRRRFRMAAVSWVGIERAGTYLRVNIHTARPGVVIGKRGADIEAVRNEIEKLTKRKTFINVMEIKEPELDARLVGEAIAMQLERRIAHRRAIRRALERTMQAGALGVKVEVKGRLGGAEIARREWARKGRVPLHTFCADIDYGLTEAHTNMGLIGIKVWIFRKTYFAKSPKELLKEAEALGQLAPMPAPEAAAPAPVAVVAAPPAPAAVRRGDEKPEKMPELPASALAQLTGDGADVPAAGKPEGEKE
ncbi:MAG: 30S ribosomal protein S3 [Elusimicrobia bacterium GWA2_69_24]|nr:MAG: 30S ribosomal protein S3 [Elusimicrobia bacterium GWA2_69_24]HBL15687.1 30S ribosomal protein S3 [Elusimicrobiota bacterium]